MKKFDLDPFSHAERKTQRSHPWGNSYDAGFLVYRLGNREEAARLIENKGSVDFANLSNVYVNDDVVKKIPEYEIKGSYKEVEGDIFCLKNDDNLRFVSEDTMRRYLRTFHSSLSGY